MIKKTSHPLLTDIPFEKTVCFTGHRPQKLPNGPELTVLIRVLAHYIELEIQRGSTHFITGLADGIDYFAACMVRTMRNRYPGIVLIGVQPCPEYEQLYRKMGCDMKHLYEMLDMADRLVVLPESYSGASTYHRRNYFMVDNAAALIGVVGDMRSGSSQTLNYAKRMNRRCYHIHVGDTVPYETLHMNNYHEWPVTITDPDTY